MKNLESDEQKSISEHSLAETFDEAALARQHPDEVDERWNIEHRREIRDGFIPKFGVSGVVEEIHEVASE